MNQDYNLGVDTIVLDRSTGDDTITISADDLFASIDEDDTITLSDWNNPLSTSLSSGLTYSAYPATAINVSSGSTGGTLSTSSGTSGATLTTTLNNGLMWNNNTAYSGTINTNWTTGYTQPQVLKVTGDAEFEGDIKIKGVSMSDRLDAIEERLGILRPNNDLEGKWEKLKKLGDEYRKLEKEILEGENIWDMLKK